MKDARAELLTLTAQLKRRIALSDELDWGHGQKKRDKTLEELKLEVESCQKCPLGKTRIKAVFGVGNPRAKVMFIGEGPGYFEDRKGEPFVGRAGQLLDKILESIGLSRQTVYIANTVKCHPMKNPKTPDARSNDRPPVEEEMDACRPYLDEQIDLIAPRFIVTLGSVSTKAMLHNEEPISKVRGIWREYKTASGRLVDLLPTFHPAALLRNPDLKKLVWMDMKNLRSKLEKGV